MQSNFYSVPKLLIPDSLAHSSIASAPLGKQTIFLFGYGEGSEQEPAEARLAIFILV